MAGGGGAGNSRELDQTPTWAVALVVAVIIMISIILEKVLHHIGQIFTEKRKTHMFEALEKVKAELMVLGFISLLLTFGQKYISKICISEKTADTMLPCILKGETLEEEKGAEHRRRLLWDTLVVLDSQRRILVGSGGSSCPKGKVALVSVNGLHQLHIFIFFLAVFHVISSAMTMTLGRAKIRAWKEWEKEAVSSDFQLFNDPARFRFSHETSFVRQHTSFWNKVPVSFYFISFFRQFARSVKKADYLAMRHGFITVHLAPGSKFDFQKYIKRSLEDDFKVVVGISPALWASAVVYLLLNVHGLHTMFWISIIPLLITLAVGTKLQAIITKMALEIKERHAVIQGIPLVQLSDHHFWFNRPHLVLFLIHFTLFQNAFQIIYFLWIWYEFGMSSCFHEGIKLNVTKIILGIGVQVICSYITLPLYALVSQMGAHMKRSIFEEQTSKALKKWTQAAKKKNVESPRGAPATNPRGSPKASTAIPLQNFKNNVPPTLASAPSRRRNHSDPEKLDPEANLSSTSPETTSAPPKIYTDLLTGSPKHQQHADE